MSASPETSRVWLITGSSRGLGRGFAEAVLAAGHRLVATARKPEQLSSFVERYGDRVRAVALDVTNPEQARVAVRTAVEAFGRLDVVVNNAGYGSLAPIEQVTDEDFRSQLDTNLFGVMNVTRAALPVLREQRSGHIIQVSSVGGRLATPGLGAYQAAKWAVGGFSEVLAKETAPFGVKVTVLEPGGFRTDWAGASMTIPDFRPEYAPTVGVVARHMRARTGKEPGDPDRAAQVLLQVAAMESPPLHLVLGSDAFELTQEKLDRLKAEDQKWKDLSLSTDFPEARGPAPRL
ncbi:MULTISPECIES: oxidoreductase [unclassified Corallococcus]|uniref:oxidoreductase n=1 Tax=unclassified Corallococcus TaxID=2685029 RepID=UPI001A8FE77B|nr:MULTISPECIES: oxidoreductase [unclassified Corallococcus]MBN9682761.1 SDR family NAD(P)-dependent oxidoreductase [Corallococcus sp. NCSPR001]WAS85698.1 oxidoreductase [Corallococcus sp. NCRR]